MCAGTSYPNAVPYPLGLIPCPGRGVVLGIAEGATGAVLITGS